MAGKLSPKCHQINPLTWPHDRISSVCSEIRWPFPTPFETEPKFVKQCKK